jgi:hypothetical protein
MLDPVAIREEISTALTPVRNSLAPNVLLRIHPNKVQDLALSDNEGDILILFPTERTIDNDRTFRANHQSRSLRVAIVLSLPNYYSEKGAAKIAQNVVEVLEKVRVTEALYPITFDSRREYSQQQRWLLEVNFDIVVRERIDWQPDTVQPPISTIRIDVI